LNQLISPLAMVGGTSIYRNTSDLRYGLAGAVYVMAFVAAALCSNSVLAGREWRPKGLWPCYWKKMQTNRHRAA